MTGHSRLRSRSAEPPTHRSSSSRNGSSSGIGNSSGNTSVNGNGNHTGISINIGGNSTGVGQQINWAIIQLIVVQKV